MGHFPQGTFFKDNAHALWGKKHVTVCLVGRGGTKCGRQSWAGRITGNMGGSNWEK